MKRIVVTLLAAFALLITASLAAPKAPQPLPAAPHAAAAAAVPAQEAGPRPAIQAAIHHLEQAQEALERAHHDFGGHRVKALEHVRKALDECNKAMETNP